ncbi:hypothetical protein NDU88_006087 [Pleurodeles waltl]|uniref:Uncharacterized protein n=1 Tax=Pleurodeles waltl TaxID=8319 RepID=A0AAV7NP83_PLEWA|nr:hypothetical protein NDU88_006087 [Pleurodeles waltl]
MPNGKSSGKTSGKPARQLLFSEAVRHSRPVASAPDPQATDKPPLKWTQSRITRWSAFCKKSQLKLIDLEDRSCRDNDRFFGFPERIEGPNNQACVQKVLPALPGITFETPLEFQRAHHLGSKGPDGASQPRLIIAYLLCHTHGPFHHDDYEIRITADFSKETNDCCKAFLVLRPHLCQLEVKYGLFERACMWISKSGQSKNLYNVKGLGLFLDGLTTIAMDITPSIPPSELGDDCSRTRLHIHQKMDATAAMAWQDIGSVTWRDYRDPMETGTRHF